MVEIETSQARHRLNDVLFQVTIGRRSLLTDGRDTVVKCKQTTVAKPGHVAGVHSLPCVETARLRTRSILFPTTIIALERRASQFCKRANSSSVVLKLFLSITLYIMTKASGSSFRFISTYIYRAKIKSTSLCHCQRETISKEKQFKSSPRSVGLYERSLILLLRNNHSGRKRELQSNELLLAVTIILCSKSKL